jgi:hypothetical protein
MIRVLAAAALAFGASAAGAATLTATPSTTVFFPGEIVTITLAGDPEGGTASSILVDLIAVCSACGGSSGTFQNEVLTAEPSAGWTVPPAPGTCSGNSCSLANTFSFGVVTGSAWAIGTVELNTAGVLPGTTIDLVFTSNPNLIYYGLSSDVVAATLYMGGIPEPGTAALMGLGLLGLGFVARSRR